ncbi:glycoside hydrolase family 47 protein [Serendipita vermifera MAFF 305830]|uniref:alpha-1,2-Mannosidase n=1 Tax=Serendipita vermifera MAFF 305830 TaxID=933852 RepID=A0A0C2WM48_SERVB|nr:glycoside hydrolase family 47 protein [Serendipita vermifera MAFF 305830]
MADNPPKSTRKRANKITKKQPAKTSGSQAGPLANVLLLVVSGALVLVTLALVPGPVQDKLLVAIGRGEKPQDLPFKTKIYLDKEKRKAVFQAFKHAWFGYERDAYGSDEYHPISKQGSNLTEAGGVGYTIIDTLDSILIFSLSEDGASLGQSYRRARKWLKDQHTFDVDGTYNTFELTIRLLGGLLSAHWAEHEVGITPGLHMENANSEDDYDPADMLYLSKAVDLAERLGHAFNTRSGLPLSNINLKTRKGIKSDVEGGLVSTAEVGTLQLEFRYLTHLLTNKLEQIPEAQRQKANLPSFLMDEDSNVVTKEDLRTHWARADHIMTITRQGTRGRLPTVFMNPEDGEFIISPIRLGSRGDSYFEYLLKQYLQTSKTEPDLLRMWDEAIDQISETLVMRTPRKEHLFIAELNPEQDDAGAISWRREPKQDHLACFLAGSLLLSAAHTRGTNLRDIPSASIPPKASDFENERAARDWKMGLDMLDACYDTQRTKTGLAPEIVHFRTKTEPGWVTDKAEGEWYIRGAPVGQPPPLDARYALRPEIVESIFIAYRLTADPKYRRWGWSIFESIEKHCKVPTGGYAGVYNVDEVPARQDDKMETFFLSETLKYLYLLFSDESVLPLDEVVFNTEAHPFPRFSPEWQTPFM